MKALMIQGPEHAAVVDVDRQEVGPDEMLVASCVVGVRHSDFELRAGKYIISPPDARRVGMSVTPESGTALRDLAPRRCEIWHRAARSRTAPLRDLAPRSKIWVKRC